ncbi:hypothetical protein P0Y35_15760 [Kiritimatiellaeota bacterium B1221]|nr:hypothetical protein [Kiritimatiellaeota bacterium B1221]
MIFGPDDLGPDNFGQDDLGPDNFGQDDLGPDDFGHNDLGPDDFGHNDFVPDDFGHNDFVPDDFGRRIKEKCSRAIILPANHLAHFQSNHLAANHPARKSSCLVSEPSP